MTEQNSQPPEDSEEDSLPALNTRAAWFRIIGILVVLVVINIVAFLVSFGVGILVTLPLTLFLAFLLIRDIIPRHRLPMGRPERGASV